MKLIKKKGGEEQLISKLKMAGQALVVPHLPHGKLFDHGVGVNPTASEHDRRDLHGQCHPCNRRSDQCPS